MKTIKIKFEEKEIEQKFVDYTEVLNILKDEDDHYMELYRQYKKADEALANEFINKAIETDRIRKKFLKIFGGEFD